MHNAIASGRADGPCFESLEARLFLDGQAPPPTASLADATPPKVTAIVVDNQPRLGPSSVDPVLAGIHTVTITFSEPVNAAAGGLLVQSVDRPGGAEVLLATLTPTSVTGSGTSQLTITLPTAAAIDTWLKVRLYSTSITDLAGVALDGEPKPGGSGYAYVYSADADLPTGDGLPGGDAVFYVASLRGDADGNGVVDGSEYQLWQQNYGRPGTPTVFTGDFDGNGVVNGADYQVWQRLYRRQTLTPLANRTISAGVYLDKLQAMWEGELLGNVAGTPIEGQVQIGGLTYAVPWPSVTATTPWPGDDDTCFEYMDQQILAADPSPTFAEIKDAWMQHVSASDVFIANRQARQLMDYGLSPPDTGSINYNMHWYAIDAQIDTESLGGAAPGLRQRAADLAGEFGSVTNDGYALHAAQFYAAMYADAPMETDVLTLIHKGLEVVPQSSRSHQVIDDVLGWWAANPADWHATQTLIYNKYGPGDPSGRFMGWTESSVNLASTTMALLYGGGNFTQTVEIAIQAGFDADCNPATAGGLIGLMVGTAGLPAVASSVYHLTRLTGMADTTLQAIAQGWQTVAEQQLLAAGGTITGTGAGRVYHLPVDTVTPPPEKPDPTGPDGLVAAVRAAGGTATVTSDRASYNTGYDRGNLNAIIDGAGDLSYDGHLAYCSNYGGAYQPAVGDWYAINFDRTVTFNKVVFSEGGIAWAGINSDPRASTPAGGYFLNLTVEVRSGGTWTTVSNLSFSEPLDPYKYFQTITLNFDPTAGDAVRIRGDAGGLYQFTSITELAAYGSLA